MLCAVPLALTRNDIYDPFRVVAERNGVPLNQPQHFLKPVKFFFQKSGSRWRQQEKKVSAENQFHG